MASCHGCFAEVRPDATFCGKCGRRTAAAIAQRDREGGLATVISYYVVMLAFGAITLIYSVTTEEYFTATLFATVAYAVVTAAYAIRRRRLWLDTLVTPGWGPLGYLLVIAASVPIAFGVTAFVDGLNGAFGIKMASELEAFEGRHIAWTIVLVAVLPPLEEEIGFRGIVYGGLRRTFGVTETFIVSSFAFAMLHLSPAMLLTHMPLGLYLCWLRHRSGSIWPGVVAHACHNLIVVLNELR